MYYETLSITSGYPYGWSLSGGTSPYSTATSTTYFYEWPPLGKAPEPKLEPQMPLEDLFAGSEGNDV